MTDCAVPESPQSSAHPVDDPGAHRFDPGSILPTTEPNLAGNYPQTSLEAVSGIFGGAAPAVYIEPQTQAIPKPLRYVVGAPNRKWQPPWQVIGMPCGAQSQGLCAIIFENEAAFRVFVASNPGLKNGLLTWWPDTNCIIWVHSTGWVPPNITAGAISWISEGIIPVAAPGLGPGHFVWQHHPVVSMPFAELKWPDEMEAAFQIPMLQHMYGPRYRRLGPRKTVLNLTFWAHFLSEKMRLAFQVHRKSFFLTGSESIPIEIDEVIKLTTHGLQQAAMLDPGKFPVAEIRLPIIKRLVEEMRVAAAVHRTSEREGLVQFLSDSVEVRKGSNLTVAELHHRYTVSCHTKALPLCPETVFQRLLPAFIRELFVVPKCNNLRRPGPEGSVHWHRGFRKLAFKTAGRFL